MEYKEPFCKCNIHNSIYAGIGEWGEWDICSNCNKPIEDSYRDYNHYDGEDHVVE